MEESYVSLAELKVILEKEKAVRGEVNPEQQYSLSHARGVDEFKLFELVPKEGVTLSVGQRVYIGKDVEMRKEVLHVKRRVGYEELTTAAQKELPFVIQETVKEKEAKFVDFFNRAQAITTRFHMLELLPGLGKKTMWGILEERKKGPFKSFQDLDQRVPSVHHPEKLIAKRIEMEISDPTQKYRLFVAR